MRAPCLALASLVMSADCRSMHACPFCETPPVGWNGLSRFVLLSTAWLDNGTWQVFYFWRLPHVCLPPGLGCLYCLCVLTQRLLRRRWGALPCRAGLQTVLLSPGGGACFLHITTLELPRIGHAARFVKDRKSVVNTVLQPAQACHVFACRTMRQTVMHKLTSEVFMAISKQGAKP